jgi:selenocysteine lyase/cysteine desulfurase
VAPDRYEIRPDARRFETWEGYVAGKVGLGVAVDYAMEWGLDAIFERVQRLAADLRQRLTSIDDVTVHDVGRVQCGITTFSTDALRAATIQQRLRQQNINTSVSPQSSTRLDATQRNLPDLVRASVHYYNTEGEIDRFAHAVRGLLRHAS